MILAARGTEPSRVFWFLPEYPPNPGGIGTFAATLAPGLARLGRELHLLVGWGGPSRETINGVDLIREPLRAAFEKGSPAAVMRCRRVVSALKEEIEPTCYHVHLSDPTPILHLATEATAPAPMVLTLHNEMARIFTADDPESLLARLMSAATVTTAVSSTAVRQAAAVVPELAHRMVTVPNGVDIVENAPPLPTSPQVLAVGRLLPQKGFDRLLRAWPTVARAVPEAHLDIIGEGPDRPLLEGIIDELGLAESVTLRGLVNRDAVPAFLARARLVVAPSRHEGMPYALLEAASYARPIVASNTGGINEVVADGTTGLLVDQSAIDEDPAVFGRAMTSLLADDQKATRLGTAARTRVQERFSVDATSSAYDHIYRAIATPPSDIAVIIPVWNGAKHLREALESVLANAESVDASVQVLVVDDGSTDETSEISASYAAHGVETFWQPNAGTAMARNAGIALTSSRYVAQLDADDVWPSRRLATLLEVLEDDATLDAAFGRAVEFADADVPSHARWNPAPMIVRMPTVGLLRRSAHDEFGGFATGIRNNDQVEWASSALARGLVYATVDDVVLHRRIHSTNQSHSRPFLQDRSRVAVLKASLDARRAAPT